MRGSTSEKKNPEGNMARKLKTTLTRVRTLNGEELRRILWPVYIMGVSAGSHATPSQKERLGKRERPWIRFQGPAQGQNTNDDDRLKEMLVFLRIKDMA